MLVRVPDMVHGRVVVRVCAQLHAVQIYVLLWLFLEECFSGWARWKFHGI